jgi:hypothetical protein
MSPNAARISVSHSSRDRALADRLIRLLRLGTDLSGQQVFYTSGTGTSVPAGENFVDYIRSQLWNTALVVQLITPSFLQSGFCMCELGAVWVSQAASFPIAVPPVTHRGLSGVLGSVQVEILDQHGVTIDRLHDRVKTVLGLAPDTASWNVERGKFLSDLPDLLRGIRDTRGIDGDDDEGGIPLPTLLAASAQLAADVYAFVAATPSGRPPAPPMGKALSIKQQAALGERGRWEEEPLRPLCARMRPLLIEYHRRKLISSDKELQDLERGCRWFSAARDAAVWMDKQRRRSSYLRESSDECRCASHDREAFVGK